MGEYATLGLDNALFKHGGNHRFTTTIGERTYIFEFSYNAVAKFWALTILDGAENRVFGPKKVVYGRDYEVDSYFVLSFFDPREEESTVTAENLGKTVIGAVGLLA